jgi:hypothetical protein
MLACGIVGLQFESWSEQFFEFLFVRFWDINPWNGRLFHHEKDWNGSDRQQWLCESIRIGLEQ